MGACVRGVVWTTSTISGTKYPGTSTRENQPALNSTTPRCMLLLCFWPPYETYPKSASTGPRPTRCRCDTYLCVDACFPSQLLAHYPNRCAETFMDPMRARWLWQTGAPMQYCCNTTQLLEPSCSTMGYLSWTCMLWQHHCQTCRTIPHTI